MSTVEAKKKKTMTTGEAGHLGGTKVSQTYGTDFYEAIGRKGGLIRGLRNEERELHDKLYEQNRVPKEYLRIRDEAHTKTEQYRILAKDYIGRMFDAVHGKLEDIEVKALIFWDASQIWTERRVWQVFNEHPQLSKLMDERKQQVGALGGERTAQRVREAEQQKEQAMSDASDIAISTETEDNDETELEDENEGGEIASPTSVKQSLRTVLFNLRELEEDLYRAISDAKGSGSHLIEITYDVDNLATGVHAVRSKSKAAQAA